MIRGNGQDVKYAASRLPWLEIESRVQPITRSVLRVFLDVTPAYSWDERVHGRGVEMFHIWVADPDTNALYHREELLLTRKQAGETWFINDFLKVIFMLI